MVTPVAGNPDNASKLAWLKAAWSVEPYNPETTAKIGETLRLASGQGLPNYRELATEAMQWFDRGIKLNRYDPFNYFRYGMCLHWLDRHDEAGPYFQKALELDPKNYIVMGYMGIHSFELGDWAAAKTWFEKAIYQAHWSLAYKYKRFDLGDTYLRIIKEKTAGQSTGK